jgi:hypothetical protein
MKVHIHIHNVGEEYIYNVQVQDQWSEYFTLSPTSTNENECTYESIEPGMNVTCENIWLPQLTGSWNVGAVLVKYNDTKDVESVHTVIGHIWEDSPLRVLPQSMYKRHFTSHTHAYFTFLFFYAVVVLIPFGMWRNAKKRHAKSAGSKSKGRK